MSDLAFENGIKMLIGKEFGGKAAGFDVRWEGRNYKDSKIATHSFLTDVLAQGTGRAPKIAEIYFQGTYLCDVSEAMRPEQVSQTIFSALQKRIERGGVN